MNELFRCARGLPAYLAAFYLPLPRWLYLALLPYAGDWAFRYDRRAAQ